MVMPSKENNHVITKDREQGEQQTIGTRCYTPLSTQLELVPIGFGPGRLLLNPFPALFSPNILPFLPLAPNNLANNYPLEMEVAARQLLIGKTEAHEIILAPSPLDPRPQHPCVRHLRHLCAHTRLERVTSNCHQQLLHLR